MNIDEECAEQVNVLCNRLKCLLKCLSSAKLNIIEELILESLVKEFAYNIRVETDNIFS